MLKTASLNPPLKAFQDVSNLTVLHHPVPVLISSGGEMKLHLPDIVSSYVLKQPLHIPFFFLKDGYF